MNILELPYDIKRFIWDKLDPKSQQTLAHTCRVMYKLGADTGYITTLSAGNPKDPPIIDVVKLYLRHYRTLQRLYVYNIDNPMAWFPEKLPRITILCRCTILIDIDPPKSDTEILYIFDPHKKSKFSVNFEKFPKLRSLHITAGEIYNIDTLDLSRLDYCFIETYKYSYCKPHKDSVLHLL